MFSPIVAIRLLIISLTSAWPSIGAAGDVQRGDRDLAGGALEDLVAGDEVGLGVELDQRAAHAGAVLTGRQRDRALGRHAVGLLGRLGEPLHAQQVGRGGHVAVRLLQRLLAVHHARASALAQVLHHGSRDVGHGLASGQNVSARTSTPRSKRAGPAKGIAQPSTAGSLAGSASSAAAAVVSGSAAAVNSLSATTGSGAASGAGAGSGAGVAAAAALADDRRRAGSTGASAAPMSTPMPAWPSVRPSSTASATRSQ